MRHASVTLTVFVLLTARGKSPHGIRPSLHPGGLRCDSVTYSRYAPSSRLVRRVQERSRCSRDFHHGLLTAYTTAAVPTAEAAGDKALDEWIGTWTSQVVFKPAAWSLKAREMSGTSKAEWILNGRYQQISSRAGEYETRELQRYEPKSGKYHKWVFSSDGSNSFWIGAWDAESSTMTWEYVDFGAGLKGKIVDRFFGGGRYESSLFMKDSRGNVLLDVRSIQTLVKKPAE